MDFQEYERQVDKTAVYQGNPLEKLTYVSIAYGGEAGEYLNEFKKHLRSNPGVYPEAEARTKMLLELGDGLWYLAQCAAELGANLELVASLNIAKLEARYNKK